MVTDKSSLVKDYKTWIKDNMKLILAIIVFGIVIFLAGMKYGSNHVTKSIIDAENKRLNEYWKQRYEEILKITMDKDNELKQLRKRYKDLVSKIMEKKREIENITPPHGKEIQQELNNLGYKPSRIIKGESNNH